MVLRRVLYCSRGKLLICRKVTVRKSYLKILTLLLILAGSFGVKRDINREEFIGIIWKEILKRSTFVRTHFVEHLNLKVADETYIILYVENIAQNREASVPSCGRTKTLYAVRLTPVVISCLFKLINSAGFITVLFIM